MENITPTLILLWDVKRTLEKGQSVSAGVQKFLQRKKTDLFQFQVEEWWRAQQQQGDFNKQALNLYRRHLLEILEMGLRGQGILQTLQSFENELILSCEDEIQNHVAQLPLRALVPLLFFIFPAEMILLIAPLLSLLKF